jgi:cell wall-associated NlpC family hydrolase
MAIINTQSLNVRSQASTDSEAWTQVTSGQRYDVVNQMDGWVELDLGDGDDSDSAQGSFVSTRDNNVSVRYALQEAIEYYPAVEAANAAAAFRNKIVNYACQFVGNPYVWGGTSLTHGCDCSGFVQSVLKNFGIYLPRVSRDQAGSGSKVSSDSMKPGDLIFYANSSGTINHVGMYIGNGQVVNAASRRSGIRIYRWNYRTPVSIRNVIGD